MDHSQLPIGNCSTVNNIREIAQRDNCYGVHHRRTNDQNYATISTLDLSVLPYEDDEWCLQAQPVCLWIGWYKSRGRTEGMWLMFENVPPRVPTEEECLTIIKHYEVSEIV